MKQMRTEEMFKEIMKILEAGGGKPWRIRLKAPLESADGPDWTVRDTRTGCDLRMDGKFRDCRMDWEMRWVSPFLDAAGGSVFTRREALAVVAFLEILTRRSGEGAAGRRVTRRDDTWRGWRLSFKVVSSGELIFEKSREIAKPRANEFCELRTHLPLADVVAQDWEIADH